MITRGTYSRSFRNLRKNRFAARGVALVLDQDVQPVAVPIDRAPQVAHLPVDLDEHLVHVPLVPGTGLPSAQPGRVLGPEPLTPRPDALVRDLDAAFEEELLHLTEGE